MDQEGRSPARLALDRNVSAALLDDPVDDRQAEAGALTLFLGGEERLEQPRARGLIDTGTGVGDTDSCVRAGSSLDVCHGAGVGERPLVEPNRQPSAVRDRPAPSPASAAVRTRIRFLVRLTGGASCPSR